jgi:gamma-glutamylcyclotransferase (GGCT)/AIG2-like uncharacterized protein YtfP
MSRKTNVFAYGTLMLPHVFFAITGCTYRTTQVTLRNYERRSIRNSIYPAMIEKPGATTRGLVYYDVHAEELISLDLYEGAKYRRIRVTVENRPGEEILCDSYILRDEFRSHLMDQDWWMPEKIMAG